MEFENSRTRKRLYNHGQEYVGMCGTTLHMTSVLPTTIINGENEEGMERNEGCAAIQKKIPLKETIPP
jgi:hypothetical protein